MSMSKGRSRLFLGVMALAGASLVLTAASHVASPGGHSSFAAHAAAPAEPRRPDVVYVPTPPEVVDAMLKVASVKPGDVVYDLGSGDGRIVIAAAQRYGVRGVGIDIDPQRIAEARENAEQVSVTHLVTFREEDLFKADFSEATVVTLYLLPSLNLKLRPRLWKELKPGTRVVSHAFDMGDWKPEQTLNVDGRMVYFWRIPGRK
jgi:SAM-dependent methyltransferase